MKTFGSLFTGFGGADLGAMMAGLTPIWGNEIDPKIAEVGNRNLGGHIKVADVLKEYPRDYDRVDVFHASPPCTRASSANSSSEINEEGTKESPLDIALAEKVIEFIEALQPPIFTLENVIAYRHFQSWKGGKKTRGILNALESNGYWVSVNHVNFADLGVPQTRTRMIVRAIKGGFVPYLPPAEPWIGWYEAIEDLIPSLPDSQFAPWQIARLPADIRSMLVSNSKTEWSEGVRDSEDPSFAVTNQSGGRLRAMIVGGANTSERDAYAGVGCSEQHEPTRCVNASNSQHWKAFVVEGSAAGNDNKFTMPVRLENEPIFTMRASQNNPRAFVIGGQYQTPNDRTDRVVQNRTEHEPIWSVTSTHLDNKAFIFNGDNATREVSIRDRHDPSFTVTDGRKHPIKGYSFGLVVAMTPRCLARFQSFPDHYILPENKTLACKGIGNAVPPLGYAKILKSLLEYI